MKTAIYLIISSLCLCASCTKDTGGFDKAVVIVIDVTDPLTIQPDEQNLYAFLGLNTDIWQGVSVMITSISEIDINQRVSILLPKGNQWMSNTVLREAQIARFKKDVHEYIQKYVIQAKTSRGHSVVYRTLSSELARLVQQSAPSKCLIVYSDLMENDSINFYNPATFSLLKTSPSSVQKSLERSYPLCLLQNVKIYCLYSPKSYSDNKQYMVVGGFFKRLFESKSANVYLCSSINY